VRYAAGSGLGFLPSDVPTVATLRGIDNGNGGAIQTLRAMQQLARASVRNPAQTVRELVLQLYQSLPPRAWMAQIQACTHYVKSQIRYVNDPTTVELVQTPEKTLQYQAGDCDDQATLLAAMLDCTGHPCRFIAVGFNGGDFSHVMTQTKISNSGDDKPNSRDWLTCETIIDKPLGWFPPGVTRYYCLKV
jgi:transglutaminase-like putative cysteine protease